MPRVARRLLPALAVLGGLAGIAWRWLDVHTRLPAIHEIAFDDPLPRPRELAIATIPEQARPPTPAELLEQRLAALSAAMEARRRELGEPTLLTFDVTGLAAEIDAIVAGVGDAAQISVHIRDLDSPHVLFDYYGDRPLNPASNQKLLTSSAALDLLGSDYTFRTRVLVADDALYLVGEGDPTLGTDDLASLVGTVVSQIDPAALRRLVVDASAFSEDRLAPGYDPSGPGLAYEPESSALSIGFNVVEIRVEPPARGSALVVTTRPSSRAIAVRNRGRIGRRRSVDASTRARDDGTLVEVTGSLPRRAAPVEIRRRVYSPAILCGTVFAELLAAASQSEPLEVVHGVAPAEASQLASLDSPPLVEILDQGLAYSNNFIAEQVLRTLAWRMTGQPGDWADGRDILVAYWAALGNDPEGVVVENGSGLSRSGRLTTAGIVDLIALAARGQRDRPGLLDALPVAGEPGTLQSRLRLSGKRVRAKTGTLDDTSGLSGVISTEAGTPMLAFSILINATDPTRLGAALRRQIEDRIVVATLRAIDDYEAQRAGISAKPRKRGVTSKQRTVRR